MKQTTNHAISNRSASTSSPSYRGGLGYLAIGGTIGAVLALLFAPKPGRQLREDIADVSKKGLDTARDKARVIGEKTSNIATSVKEKAEARYGSASRNTGARTDSTFDSAVSAADAWADKQEAKLSDTEKGFRPPSSIG